MNPWLIVAFLLALATSFGSGVRVGIDHERSAQLAAVAEAEAKRDQANAEALQISNGYEKVIAWQNTQIQKAQKGWRDALNSPVYRDCKLDPVGLYLINNRIREANVTRQLDIPVPAGSGTPASSDDGRPDAKPVGPGGAVQPVLGKTPGAGGSGQ